MCQTTTNMKIKDRRKMSTVTTSTADAKQKRSIRNRERLMNHQSKLLDNFITGVNNGFSDENWNNLSKLYKQISEFLSLDEMKTLGELWRNSYAEHIKPEETERLVKLVKLNMIINLPIRKAE